MVFNIYRGVVRQLFRLLVLFEEFAASYVFESGFDSHNISSVYSGCCLAFFWTRFQVISNHFGAGAVAFYFDAL